MKSAFKRLVRAALPAPVYDALTRHRRLHFTGPYPSWSDAVAVSTGYDAPAILERATRAARAVAAGEAAYERDTFLFYEAAADPGLLAEITALAATRPAGLRVLDYGGALGSTWFQHRTFFAHLPPIHWHIVEQPATAARGRAEFTTPTLKFHESLDSALAPGPPDLVLLSSVLQYLPNPWTVLGQLADLPARAWIIGRTPFADRPPADAVVVQHVPASIYRASYPAWIFSRSRFAAFWAARPVELSWHPALDGAFTTGKFAFEYRTALVRATTVPRTQSASL